MSCGWPAVNARLIPRKSHEMGRMEGDADYSTVLSPNHAIASARAADWKDLSRKPYPRATKLAPAQHRKHNPDLTPHCFFPYNARTQPQNVNLDFFFSEIV